MSGMITVEKSQRSEGEKPWWWLTGETYPHRHLLKQHGARFSGRRKAWYYIGWTLPAALQALVCDEAAPAPETATVPSVMSAALERQIMGVLASDEAEATDIPAVVHPMEPETPPAEEAPPAIRVTKPIPIPSEGEALDAVQSAIREAKSSIPLPQVRRSQVQSPERAVSIAQTYCGELTGSITGQVFCYGWAVHGSMCVYVNMAGPRTGVEAIRAKLGKGDIVTVVLDEGPSLELTAGEGNSGMYTAYLTTIPEARFTSLILLHDWLINPDYSGAATTFIIRTSDEQAQAMLRHHIMQLVNLPMFDTWTSFLWTAGQAAMLVHPTRSAGGIDLLTVTLDTAAWTRLITGGLDQSVIKLPDNR